MHPIPDVWSTSHGFLHRDRLRREAAEAASRRPLPVSLGELTPRLQHLRAELTARFGLEETSAARPPLEVTVHGTVRRAGYEVRRVSYQSEPGVRVTGTLTVPDGPGPFPAVLNMHGHWSQGKVAAAVQARGHLLALNGIVTLSVDAAGAGERGEHERQWHYHGAFDGAAFMLYGDTLLAQMVRDNRRGLDLLESLPFVDKTRLAATGASGGGNQTMWLSALDERVRAVVLVVSVGTFEGYITERNCICETLPNGLALAEEWELLSLLAPRPLLILNALHDIAPAFQPKALEVTARQLKEVYELHDARERLDARILDTTHGYHPPMCEAMLGWFLHWLKGEPGSSPRRLPDYLAIEEEALLCYPPNERPPACGYRELRNARRALSIQRPPQGAGTRETLAEITGWQPPVAEARWQLKRTLAGGTRAGVVLSPRGTPLPTVLHESKPQPASELRLILTPYGKRSPQSQRHWAQAIADGAAVAAADLPGTGELLWEEEDVAGTRLHDTARACLWLGYTLAAEWAESIGALVEALKHEMPNARLHLIAEQEAAFAALLCRALRPELAFELTEVHPPTSAETPQEPSLLWIIPGFLPWGDLDALRRLAACKDLVTPRG